MTRHLTISPTERLLAWYDRHHRDLPWRVAPAARARGEVPDPYRVWLSEVMLQQTTVAAVTAYFLRFTQTWPTVEALAAAESEAVMAAWAGLGYYSRARNLHACAKEVAARGGFPNEEAELRKLPGIGPYTASAIAAIAFDRPAPVMDGNVERVMARRFAETDPLPALKPRLYTHAAALTPETRPGDYAQAVMDLGATICTPRRPACGICPWIDDCAGRKAGIAETLPQKIPKKPKPIRHGTAFAAFCGGRVATVIRPPKGLLGGMRALPSTEWQENPAPEPLPPFQAKWRPMGEIRHTFTHFHLRLHVSRTETADQAGLMPVDDAISAMPTVFAKALKLALSIY
ncbi:MAG: A/G-specific adenine glycosylase [Pseudomonadota bacterium]